MNKLLKLNLLLLLVCLFLNMAHASEITDKIDSWKAHIIEKGNYAGKEFDSPDYKSLVKMGPNCLPELFEAFRDEWDLHVSYYYSELIRRIAHFDFFLYTVGSHKVFGTKYKVKHDEDLPFLSEVIDHGKSQYEKHFNSKYKLLKWWDQRKTFLKRGNFKQSLRAITGESNQDFVKYDKLKSRKMAKLHGYGIFNIPYYIEVIASDNNPIVFCEFLRISNHKEFQVLKMTNDKVLNVNKAQAKYPTVEAKIKLISDWWTGIGHTYTSLTELHIEIDKSIKKLSTVKPEGE